MSGTAKFEVGQTEVNIKTTKIHKDTLIYITPTSKTDGLVIYIKEKIEDEGFTVALDTSEKFKAIFGLTDKEEVVSAPQPIEFNWLVINQR